MMTRSRSKSMKVGYFLSTLSLYLAAIANTDLFAPEYKTWKKNSPFLYDMVFR